MADASGGADDWFDMIFERRRREQHKHRYEPYLPYSLSPEWYNDRTEVGELTRAILHEANRFVELMNRDRWDEAFVAGAVKLVRTCRPLSDRLDKITRCSPHAISMRCMWQNLAKAVVALERWAGHDLPEELQDNDLEDDEDEDTEARAEGKVAVMEEVD